MKTRLFGVVGLYVYFFVFVVHAQNNQSISISGTVLMLDETTPHVAIVVQAMQMSKYASEQMSRWRAIQGSRVQADLQNASVEGEEARKDENLTFHVSRFTHEVVATTLTDEQGKYQFVNLKPGRYQVRCYTTNGYVY
ncbi:hypothetical protein HYR99_34870 [Candidatus Poribacteria bacterium]|nr:hypothetical protein [Candidatus Poribacteria bacterium]